MDPNSSIPNQQVPPNQAYGPVAPAPATFGAPISPTSGPKNHSLGLVIATVILSLFLVGALAFAFWAFAGRQDYKNNVDAKISTAVTEAEKRTTDANNARYAEEAKNPLKTFRGPASYGNIALEYPKTWSGYVTTVSSGRSVYTAYFHPEVVPNVSGNNDARQAIALQVSVQNQAYDAVVSERKRAVEDGRVTAVPYELPKVPGQAGMKFTGQIDSTFKGTEYILPLRDKTLVITTQTDQYIKDIDTFILPNFSFVP